MTHDMSFEEDVIDRLARIEQRVMTAGTHLDDLEIRTRGLEKKVWIVSGVAASVYPILSMFGVHFPRF